MSNTREEYLELQGQLQQKLCALQTQSDMLSKIKMTALQDAFDYEEACHTQTDESWLTLPPNRYLDPKVQAYYASQFWAYLRDIRGEGVVFGGTE